MIHILLGLASTVKAIVAGLYCFASNTLPNLASVGQCVKAGFPFRYSVATLVCHVAIHCRTGVLTSLSLTSTLQLATTLAYVTHNRPWPNACQGIAVLKSVSSVLP